MTNRYPTDAEIEDAMRAKERAKLEADLRAAAQAQNRTLYRSVIAEDQYPWRQYTNNTINTNNTSIGISNGTTMVSEADTISDLKRQVESNRQEIAMLRKMLEHPDRPIIQDIEGIIEHGSSSELFRAHPPFDYRAVWAKAKTAGNGLAQTLQVTLRDGTTKALQVVGFAVRDVRYTNTVADQSGGAYFLPVDVNRMTEMEKKQVATDLIASIIEERVIEKMEREK